MKNKSFLSFRFLFPIFAILFSLFFRHNDFTEPMTDFEQCMKSQPTCKSEEETIDFDKLLNSNYCHSELNSFSLQDNSYANKDYVQNEFQRFKNFNESCIQNLIHQKNSNIEKNAFSTKMFEDYTSLYRFYIFRFILLFIFIMTLIVFLFQLEPFRSKLIQLISSFRGN